MLYLTFNILFSIIAVAVIALYIVYWYAENLVTIKDIIKKAKAGDLAPLIATLLAAAVGALLSIFVIALIFHLIPGLWWLLVGFIAAIALIVLAVYNDW